MELVVITDSNRIHLSVLTHLLPEEASVNQPASGVDVVDMLTVRVGQFDFDFVYNFSALPSITDYISIHCVVNSLLKKLINLSLIFHIVYLHFLVCL